MTSEHYLFGYRNGQIWNFHENSIKRKGVAFAASGLLLSQ
jgi:hypothetical protein